MSRIAVINNRLSHLNRARLRDFRRALAEDGSLESFEIDDINEISSILKQLSENPPDILAINGGDGTVVAAISVIMNEKPFATPPPILVIPGGKTNMIAADLHGTGDARRIFEKARTMAGNGDLAGNIASRALIEVRRSANEPPVFGLFFGTASVVRGIEFCRRRIYPLNLPNGVSHLLSVLLIIVSALWPWKTARSSFRPERVMIDIGNQGLADGDYFIVIVTTLHRMLLGSPSETAAGDGGLRVHAVPYRFRALVRGFFAYFAGRGGRKERPGALSRSTDSAILRFTCPFTLDGELYDPRKDRPVELRNAGRLNFVQVGR